MGKSRWLNAPELGVAQSNAEPEAEPVRDVADEVDSVMVVAEPEAADAEGDDLQASHLLVARGKQPLSLWDWKIWTMAKPRLWRYGDAGNLFGRDTNLSTTEWAACLLLREELQYAVDRDVDDSQAPVRTGMASQSDAVDFQAPVRTGMASQSAAVDYLQDDAPGLVAPGQGLQSAAVDGEEDGRGEAARLGVGSELVCNRFSGDWAALHMLATVCRLTDQRAASYHFLKNGGMAFAKKLEKLSAADLASAARVAPGAGGMEEFLKEPAVAADSQGCSVRSEFSLCHSGGHGWPSSTVSTRRRRLHGGFRTPADFPHAKCSRYSASAAIGNSRGGHRFG